MEETSINSRTVYCVTLYVKSLNFPLEAEFIQTSKHLVPSSAGKQNNEKIWLWIPLNHPSFLEVYTNPNSSGRDSEKELPTSFSDITYFFSQKILQKCLCPDALSPHAISNKCIDHKNLTVPQYFTINWSRRRVTEEVVKILRCLWSALTLRSKLKRIWL